MVTEPSWKLPSSRGWEILECRIEQVSAFEGDLLILSSFTIASNYWNRLEIIEKGTFNRELREDYVITFHQVVSRRSQFLELAAKLESWRQSRTEMVCELTSEDRQLRLSLGENPKFLIERGKSSLNVNYKTLGLETMAAFIVDESCVAVALDGLRRSFLEKLQ